MSNDKWKNIPSHLGISSYALPFSNKIPWSEMVYFIDTSKSDQEIANDLAWIINSAPKEDVVRKLKLIEFYRQNICWNGSDDDQLIINNILQESLTK
eukprot:Awhi_evm1s13316